MKKPIHIISFIFLIAAIGQAKAWGFLGHRLINNRAVYALPPEMFGLYKKHIEYITKHSVDPDNRRYLIAEEGCRHYLDCDHYEFAAPLDTIPHRWNEAVLKYTEDTLTTHGIVPWHCLLMLSRLTKAFEEKNLQRILKLSADIGHYIADAHVPLHASHNYNGQHTGQEGIHALWESRIPQLYADSFDLISGTADYLVNPSEFIWTRVSESFSMVQRVLKLERDASNIHLNNKFSFESRGTQTMRVYSEPFCRDYNLMMEEMVEQRMRESIKAVAAFWYTAWVNGGQPNLDKLAGMPDETEEDAAEKARQTNPIKGRPEHGID